MPDEIVRETWIPAEPDDVWRSLTEPERLEEWLGGEVTIELEPGGVVHVDDRTGFVEDVECGRRLSFWWSTKGEDATRVELELEDEAEGTRVRVVESRPMLVLDGRDLAIEFGTQRGAPEAMAA